MPQAKSAVVDWLKQLLSPGTVLTLATIIVTAAIQHGAQEERMSAMDKRLTTIETRYVPREEHASRDEWLKDELREIRREIGVIQEALLERHN